VQNVAIALAAIVLLVWTVFPFLWILLTSFEGAGDIISVPPTFVFTPTTDNYAALVMGEQSGQRASTRPDFRRFFLNSMIISIGAVALSVRGRHPCRLTPWPAFTFPLEGGVRLHPHELPVRAVHRLRHPALPPLPAGRAVQHACRTDSSPISSSRCPSPSGCCAAFFMEVPLEIQEAAKIDGCSWLGVLGRVILPLSMPGIAVTVILGFMFSWNAFNYPLMLAGRQTFPVTVGAIQSSPTSRCCGDRWQRQRSLPPCRNFCSA